MDSSPRRPVPLDPDVEVVLQAAAKSGIPPYHLLGVTAAREMRLKRLAASSFPVVAVDRVEDLGIGLSDRELRVRIYAPTSTALLPGVAYFHGSGWVFGNLDTHDHICRRLAVRANCLVMSVDYRLAPEHPFPYPLDDCWAGLLWLRDNSIALGVDSQRLAVSGESAGGNLAAAVALRARDTELELRLQQLVYPVLDCDFTTRSYRVYGEGFGLSRAAMTWYWQNYVPVPIHRFDPEASPLRAPTLRHVAPAHIIVCECDPLRDEGVAYCGRLRSNGVRVQFNEYRGLIHGTLAQYGSVARADEMLTEMADALREALI